MTSGTNNGAITVTNQATSQSNLGIGAVGLANSPLNGSLGGTGLTSVTLYGLLYGSGTNTAQVLAPGTNGQIVIGHTAGAPAWGSVTSSDGSMTLTLGSGSFAVDVTQATTSQTGGSTLCTGAQAVTGTDPSLVVTPSTLTSALAAPTSIGGTTPNTAAFTTITLTTTSGPTITTGSGAPSASAPLGSLYLRTNGSITTTRAYINTNGSTTWTPLITVA